MAQRTVHLLVILGLFAVLYFGVVLPLFQRLSRHLRRRRFTLRLGSPWDVRDPEHRWDVLMSFLSFVTCLALTLWLVDLGLPFTLPPAN